MNQIRLKKITLKCKNPYEAIIFDWVDEGHPINIFHYSNEAGKSTLFKVIKDVLEFEGLRAFDIFTGDLLNSGIEAIIEYEILDNESVLLEITARKDYVSGEEYIDINSNGDIETYKDGDSYRDFLTSYFEIPSHIIFSSNKKINFNTIIQLSFVSDEGYKSKTADKTSFSDLVDFVSINDRDIPIIFAYILNIINDENDLKDLFRLTGHIRLLENQNKEYTAIMSQYTMIENLKKKKNHLQVNFFDEMVSVDQLNDLEENIKELIIDRYNFQEGIKNIESILAKLSQEYLLSENSEVRKWIDLLNAQRAQFLSNFENINRTIKAKKEERNRIKKLLESIQDVEIKQLAANLRKDTIILKANSDNFEEFKQNHEHLIKKLNELTKSYERHLERLARNQTLVQFDKLIKLLSISESEDLKPSFDFIKGKVKVKFASDSTNRLARFVTHIALTNLKNIKHFKLMVMDSPFIGVNQQRILETIVQFVENQDTNTQIFLFTNKDDNDKLNSSIFDDFQQTAKYISGEVGEKIFKLPQPA